MQVPGEVAFGILAVLALAFVGFAVGEPIALRMRWSAFAKQHNLVYQRNGGHKLSGGYRRRMVTITMKTHRSVNNNPKKSTHFSVNLHEFRDVRFKLSNQGVGALMQKAMGKEDVTLGDDSFDRAYRIESEPDEFVKLVLGSNDGLRQKLRQIGGMGVEMGVGRAAYYEVPRQISSPAKLQAIVDTLCDLAEAAETAAASAAPEAQVETVSEPA